MNKQQIVIISVIAVIVIGIIGFVAVGRPKGKTATPQPTPVEKVKPVDDSVKVNVTPNDAKNEVTIIVTGMNGRYTALEYELTYNTANKGQQGALSGKPIPLDAGADTFTRPVTLGTCSRNVCIYDKVVGAINLAVKFHLPNGTSQFFKKDFQLFTPGVSQIRHSRIFS